jgi:hypothetical protein
MTARGTRHGRQRGRQCRGAPRDDRGPDSQAARNGEVKDKKFGATDIRLKDYKKRRSAFLEELIASTPKVSVRAKEFRRWIDENSPYGDNDKA